MYLPVQVSNSVKPVSEYHSTVLLMKSYLQSIRVKPAPPKVGSNPFQQKKFIFNLISLI